MSQENTRVVMQLFEAASKRDLERMATLLTPDTVWTSTYQAPFDGEFRGPRGALELLSRLIDAFDVFDVELQHVVAQGELVVLILREKMRSKVTGKVGMNNAAVAVTVKDGKVDTVRMYGDSYVAWSLLQLG